MSESLPMDNQSLTKRFVELMEARKYNDPRIEAMLVDVRQLRTATQENSAVCNRSLGNSREAVSDVQLLKAELLRQKDENAALRELVVDNSAMMTVIKSELAEMQAAIATQQERIEKMAQWAKTVVK
jgi:hypothetical protein